MVNTLGKDTKGILSFSLREYIRDNKQYMPCVIPDSLERIDLFILFLNKHKVILDWNAEGVHIHQLSDVQEYDTNTYLSFKTKLCIAVSKGKAKCEIPTYTHGSYSLYWVSILRAIHNTEKTMNVKITVISENTIKIGRRLW